MKGEVVATIITVVIICILVGIISVLAGWEPEFVTFALLALVVSGVAAVALAAGRDNETW